MNDIVTLLNAMLWLVRVLALVVGIYTIRFLYQVTPTQSPCRGSAGRISGAIALWLAAIYINAFLVDGNEMVRVISRILINFSPMMFCLSIVSIARNESQHPTQ